MWILKKYCGKKLISSKDSENSRISSKVRTQITLQDHRKNPFRQMIVKETRILSNDLWQKNKFRQGTAEKTQI